MIKCDNCGKRAKYNIQDAILIYHIDEDGDYILRHDYLETSGGKVNLHLCQEHYEDYWNMEGKEVQMKRYSIEYSNMKYILVERTKNIIIYENSSMKKVIEYAKENNIKLINEKAQMEYIYHLRNQVKVILIINKLIYIISTKNLA